MFEKLGSSAYSPESPETLDAEAARLCAILGVAETDEKRADDGEEENRPEAVELGERRSFQNIRDSLKEYLKWRIKIATQPDQETGTAEFAQETPISFSRKDLEAVFDSSDYTPEKLMALFEQDFATNLAGNDGFLAGYDLRTHTLMNMGQFEKYFANKELPGGVSKNFFRTVDLMHDFGKPKSVQDNRKKAQHEYTLKIMLPVLKRLDYTPREIDIARALVDGDTIGEFIIRKLTDDEAAEKIINSAHHAGMSAVDFMELLSIYYQVDAGSYTADAGGRPQLDKLFVFDPEHGNMDYASDIKQRMDALSDLVNQKQENLDRRAEAIASSGAQPELIVSELENKVQETRGNLVMSYYKNLSDAESIINDGALKNIFEFSGAEQDERKKSMESSLQDALNKRIVIDEALGWKRPETVYHLAVESQEEGHHPDGPSSGYGSIRFVFDYDTLAKTSTFSEGDSLNPAQLPQALADKNIAGAARGIEKRQLSKEHVPIAKAIFSLSTELEDRRSDEPIFLRYIEAQVGEVSGADIFKTLKAIEVNLDGAFKEARLARLLLDQTKEDALYEQYFHRKFGTPRVLDFDNPAPPDDREGYDAAIVELRMSNFTRSLDEMRTFCESKGITYKQDGNMQEIRDLCLQLAQQGQS